MSQNFYNLTLQTLTIVCIFAGIEMFMFSSEKKKEFPAYKRSRYLAGTVILLYGFLCFIEWFFRLRDINVFYASSFSLSIYYLAAILFGYSLIPLLDNTYTQRKRIVLDIMRYMIFLTLISFTVLSKPKYALIFLSLAGVYFFIDALRLSILLIRKYRKCIHNINEYYSDYQTETYVHWMSQVSIFIILYGLSFTFIFYTKKEWIAAFSFLGIFLIGYITICFNNYLMHIEKIDKSQEISELQDQEEKQINTESLSFDKIENCLQEWIQQKRFLEEGVTISSLCENLKTNRTYLSYYINNSYGCSFRDFISKLRIEEAKKLLESEPAKDIHEISVITGFASTSSFYRTFSKLEKTTPASYRSKKNQS